MPVDSICKIQSLMKPQQQDPERQRQGKRRWEAYRGVSEPAGSIPRILSLTMRRNTPPNGTENVAVAESVLFGGTMAQEDTFLLDPNLDLSSLFPFQMPVEFRTASSFVTPQTVRTEGGEIQAVMPSMEHHGAAGAFADGLNNIVADVVGNGGMTAEEIVYVLETFTDTFKIGLAMPVNGF